MLLLDDPTRGVDVGAKAELYRLIDGLGREGIGIIITSSELPELLTLCDRILVLCEGRLTAKFPRAEATEQIMEAAMAALRKVGSFGLPVGWAPPTTRPTPRLPPGTHDPEAPPRCQGVLPKLRNKHSDPILYFGTKLAPSFDSHFPCHFLPRATPTEPSRRTEHCLIRGELAEELQRTKGLTLKPAVIQGTFWIYFPTNGTRSRHGTTRACGRRRAGHRPQHHQPGAHSRPLEADR